MISPSSSEMAASMSSRTPGGSSIAESALPNKEFLSTAGESVSFKGPMASKAPFSESRSLGEAERRTILVRSEEHTSELQSRQYIVCRLLLEKKDHYHQSQRCAMYAISTREESD